MKTAVVIGSNSFSGADFVDLLLEETDFCVVGISRSPEKGPLYLPYLGHAGLSRFTFHQVDMNRAMPELLAILADLRPSYVVNFAALTEVAASWQDSGQWFATNAVAVANLTSWLRGKDWLEKYVQISTPEVYGSCEGRVLEDARFDPSTPYAASKAAADLMVASLVKTWAFPAVTIRATNVYGAHQQLYKIIPRTAIYLRRGEQIELHGGGKAVKSFIHIRDVSRGELSAMLEGEPGDVFHLSPDGGGIAIRELVRRTCEMAGRSFEACTRSTAERPGQDKAYVIDSSKARTELGWRPRVGLDEGLKEVIQWVDRHWDAIRKEPLEYVHVP